LAAKRGQRKVTVHFFRVIVDGQRDPYRRLRVQEIQQRLESLQPVEGAGDSYYYRDADDNLFMAWSKMLSGHLQMTLGRELLDASPTKEKEGALKVAELGDKERWVAPTFVVFFPEKNLAGMIFSQEASRRVAPLLRYIEERTHHPQKVELELLVRPDIEAELKKLKAIRTIDLQYHPSPNPPLFDQHQDLDGLMRAIQATKEAATVRIIISAGRKPGASLSSLRDNLLRLVKRDDFAGTATKLVVSGPNAYNKKNYEVDLLTQELSASVVVQLAKGAKVLDPEIAYRAITEAYADRLTEFPSVAILDD
jgi:hypothetical protein